MDGNDAINEAKCTLLGDGEVHLSLVQSCRKLNRKPIRGSTRLTDPLTARLFLSSNSLLDFVDPAD